MDHYFRTQGAKQRLWAVIQSWFAQHLDPLLTTTGAPAKPEVQNVDAKLSSKL